MMRRLLAAALFAAPQLLAAQGGTDIFVATFSDVAGKVSVGRPANVTRRAGYDNQPAFTRDGSAILFTRMPAPGAAPDIWRVPAVGGPAEPVTETAESEYSATPVPGKRQFSTIRVELDSTQRLWRFDDDGTHPALVLTALKPVGYHLWLADGRLATFVLGQPNALVIADPLTERADTVARDIGRALARVPDRAAFSFVQAGRDTSWISEVDTRTNAIRRIAPALSRDGYHLWTPSGRLVTASGTRLLIRNGERWDVLVDFAELGIKGISRLALSPRGDRLAFVAEDLP